VSLRFEGKEGVERPRGGGEGQPGVVELYEDDVWLKGFVLRKSPAGVFVYLPGGGWQ
jgi:acetyl esterase/lipase